MKNTGQNFLVMILKMWQNIMVILQTWPEEKWYGVLGQINDEIMIPTRIKVGDIAMTLLVGVYIIIIFSGR